MASGPKAPKVTQRWSGVAGIMTKGLAARASPRHSERNTRPCWAIQRSCSVAIRFLEAGCTSCIWAL